MGRKNIVAVKIKDWREMKMIFAHRGASGYAPENTMAAFRLAEKMNSDGIELDIQLTKDGEVIICHDEKVNRTTNGTGYLKDYTLKELQKLDAGSWFSNEFRGERIPTLDEFLAFASKTNLVVNIEIKNIPFFYQGIEKKMLDLISKYKMLDRVLISSFDHYTLAKVAKLNPQIKLGVLFSTRIIDPVNYVRHLPFKVYSVHPHVSFVDKKYIQAFHEYDYKIYPYTVDSLSLFKKLTSYCLDGCFTNFPDKMKGLR